MLNKDICKKCINKQWNEDDEKIWKINIIFCAKSCTKLNLLNASSALSGYRSINEPPPKQCPYYLEHLLIEKS